MHTQSHWRSAVQGAGMLSDTLAVVGAVDVHFAAAVGAVEQADERGGFYPAVRVTLHIGADSLHILKGFRGNNGGMGILKITHSFSSR